MKTKPFRSVNYIGWVLIVLTFAFIYFSYFFIYIPKQKSDLTQRAFRILKEYGNNMVGKYGYYQTHFKNYGFYYSVKHLKESKTIEITDEKTNNIEEVLKDLSSFVKTGYPKSGVADSSFDFNDTESRLLLNFYYQVPDTFNMNRISGLYRFQAGYTSEKPIDNLLRQKIINQVPIDKFMEGLKFDELFDNIVLFNRETVLYNSNLEYLVDITNPKHLSDTTDYAQGGIYKELKIRGKTVHIMIIPIDFDNERFYISGLITDVKFKSITRTFNSRILILVAGILLLIFVGMPLLKTLLIGPKERLKLNDVAGSAISILFGSALFVLIIIGLLKQSLVDKTELNNRIELISDSLYANVSRDFWSLKTLGYEIATMDSTGSALAGSVINTFNSSKHFFQDSTLKYPFPLNEIILINPSGIVKRGYTRTAFSDALPVNLSERQYFKNVIDTLLAWPTMNDSWFYIESIKSYNTGDVETAVSFYTKKYSNSSVLAVTSKIPSLYHQILPRDIEFLLIDKTGKVLYHSQQSKNLHENFIEECESDPHILNAIQLRVTEKMRIKYNEKKWLARIKPLEDTQLYHITLLDLNQTDNKNARIFLLTFYLMIGLQIFTLCCFLLLRFSFKPENDSPRVFMFLKWLAFMPVKYNAYKGLVIILSLTAVSGISSFIIQADLVNVLLLQFVSIGFTFLASLLFLRRRTVNAAEYFKGKYFPENLIFACIGVLIIIFLVKFKTSVSLIIPLLILLFTAIIIPVVYKHFVSNNEYKGAQYPAISKVKQIYLTLLFLWLAIFSVVPVIHSYYSIKHFEEKIWQQQQFFKVAGENLNQLNIVKNDMAWWVKSIMGNGLDRLTIKEISKSEITKRLETEENRFTASDKIYDWLPDPITNKYNKQKLANSKNKKDEWYLSGDSLFYTRGGQKGAVLVTAEEKPNAASNHFFLIAAVFFLTALCIWHLVKFAAAVFLNLDDEKPVIPEVPWINFLNAPANRQILLKSFNGDLFWKETNASLKKTEEKLNAPLQAFQLLSPDFDYEKHVGNDERIIWIAGLNECVPEITNHRLMLDNLTKINHMSKNKVVIEYPFETGLIEEFYDDYVSANELTSKELSEIYLLRKRWKNIFEDYSIYDGYISQVEPIIPNKKLSEKLADEFRKNMNPELCYANIWKNLTNYEKIVLYDLADDGLMNRNNKKIILQLARKRLIASKPLPMLFTPGFSNYVYMHITRTEITEIEGKLGLKGNWRNAKYLILLVLIPLAAFIFISQGLTIEKSFGIFAGIIGAITTLMKLFENSTNKK
jgi:hypothetical protein